MTVTELYRMLDIRIPSALSCDWDNDGLMCCPDGERQVKKVLVTLDVTLGAVNAAIDGGYDLIVSHHPLIFKGMKAINGDDHIGKKALKLIKNGISVFSFHTRLDAVAGGVNDTLASLLCLEDVGTFESAEIGRIGTLPESTDAETLAARVRELLGADGVRLSDAGRPCHRIAVLGGNGGDDVEAAIAAGADTYISGDLKFHSMTDAPELGINLIQAGHFYTEDPVCTVLCRMIEEADSGIICDLFCSNTVKLI